MPSDRRFDALERYVARLAADPAAAPTPVEADAIKWALGSLRVLTLELRQRIGWPGALLTRDIGRRQEEDACRG